MWVSVCVWVLWACNVRLTPKQLNVEIQEIQVNIKRKNYVNQKVKATWNKQGATLETGSEQNIKVVAKKIFSAKASVRVERGKYITRFQLAERSKPKMDHAESQQRRSRSAAQRVGSKVA